MAADGSPRKSLLARLRDSPMRWIVLGLVTGVVSGLAAVVFVGGLEYVSHFTMTELAGVTIPQPPGEQFIEFEPSDTPRRAWLFFLLPAIGGLISGFLVYRYAPEAEGPGTDAMIRSFHRERGEMRPRVPLVKGLATIATLATGGSAGKEGPIAQIGAGIGSILGSKLGLTAKDRRILLLAGTAGGLGAVFRAPLGSAITAIEVLYREDFESDALIPCVISSVMAYVTFVMCLGGARIFDVPRDRPDQSDRSSWLPLARPGDGTRRDALHSHLLWHARPLFRRLPLPRPLIPMIGGLGVGLIGFWFPQAYGAGWGYVQQALDGELVIQTMLFVLFAKLFATFTHDRVGRQRGRLRPDSLHGRNARRRDWLRRPRACAPALSEPRGLRAGRHGQLLCRRRQRPDRRHVDGDRDDGWLRAASAADVGVGGCHHPDAQPVDLRGPGRRPLPFAGTRRRSHDQRARTHESRGRVSQGGQGDHGDTRRPVSARFAI